MGSFGESRERRCREDDEWGCDESFRDGVVGSALGLWRAVGRERKLWFLACGGAGHGQGLACTAASAGETCRKEDVAARSLSEIRAHGYTGTTMRIVIDTSVLVAALRSSRGASHQLLKKLPSPRFQPALSVALYMEWQAVLSRQEHIPAGVSAGQVQGFLRYLALLYLQDIHYLWRPFLRDPNDDMVLECAVASGSAFIVTHNIRDFDRARMLGVRAIKPSDFLHLLENAS